jgi:hypothetical protein
MATLCKTYSSEAVARQAVEALWAAGVPGRDIRLLTGCRRHDVRREPVGGWAGRIPPGAKVGTYGNALRLRRQAKGGWAGHPDEQRQGTFADADRDVVITGDGRAHTAGDREVVRLLREAALPREAVDRVLGDLHGGRAVVLAEVAEIAPGDAEARLEDFDRVT